MLVTIYPKKGEPFTLEIPRFTFSENGFSLYDSAREISKDGFLSFENIAAIVPQGQSEIRRDDILFHVYLRNREKPLEIAATAVNTDEPPSVKFYTQYYGSGGNALIEHVYVALSEVVAIIPSNGLIHRWG
jgi:hypothetical protein